MNLFDYFWFFWINFSSSYFMKNRRICVVSGRSRCQWRREKETRSRYWSDPISSVNFTPNSSINLSHTISMYCATYIIMYKNPSATGREQARFTQTHIRWRDDQTHCVYMPKPKFFLKFCPFVSNNVWGRSTEISDVGHIQKIPRERQIKAMTSPYREFCRSVFAALQCTTA